MSTWASIAKSEPPKPAPAPVVEKVRPSVAVIDANAIISGTGLLNLMASTEKVVTIPEVLREVRDKQSRAALAALPFTIQTQEPTEESVKAVVAFARATGDLHALSAVDTRLLALTHTLETSYYGSAHLRDRPPPPKVQKKRVNEAKALPGWGAEGGDWAAIDRLNEEEEAAAAAALSSGSALAAEADAGASRIAAGVQQLSLDDAAAAAGAAVDLNDGAIDAGDSESDSEDDNEDDSSSVGAEEGEEEDGDGWEVAAKTKNKARRQKRKAYRRAEAAAQAIEALEIEAEAEEDEGEDSGSGSDDETETASALGEEEEEGPAHPAGESAVACITADFAMQNVLLQMGLRLSAPDGRRLTSVARWALRCSACFQVTKEVGRLFCPRCGNAALDKVRVVVGPNGAEQYGVKKRHVLRGTKFSLPKPKGGRSADPILREDQLLTKKHLLRAKKAAERAAADQLDPFAPEYTADTWHQAAAVQGGQQGAAALLAGWKRNPNERKHRATNRRRK